MIVNGWLDWATRIDGVVDKVYSQPNAGIGLACHSVVGRENEFQDGVPNRFLSTEKGADGRYTASAAASCMFVLRESGELIQMHPITASTWTSGGFDGNTKFWAVEAEGGLYPNYGEQLTAAAQNTFIRLVTEWEAHTGMTATPNVNILQHRQIATLYGYAPTACASGRYDTAWHLIAAGERYGDELGAADIERIARLERIVAGNALHTEVWDGNVADLQAVGISHPIVGTGISLHGEQALAYADRRGFSFALGVKLAQDSAGRANAAIAEHVAKQPGGRTGPRDTNQHRRSNQVTQVQLSMEANPANDSP